MIGKAIRAVWDEPRVPGPARRPWWDVALVAALVPVALLEGLGRDDVPWPAVTISLGVVCVLALLWRAQYPLGMLVLAFGAQTLAGVGPAFAADTYGFLYTTAVVLLFPYSLGRWASGPHIVAGAALLVAAHLLREPLAGSPPAEVLVGAGFLLLPVALGVAVRFWVGLRRREAEDVRLRERARLARDLHDSVAHHVSGIVIQAQAGQVIAARDPERALGILPAIEAEAARSLAEMRSLVGALREGEPAERAPVPGVADLPRLAAATSDGPEVRLQLVGDVDRLGPALDAAVYRVAQEAVTNARRHARGATRVDVRVEGDAQRVRVEVVDDGMAAPSPGGSGTRGGFGIAGMRERVALLGGSLEAGPRPGGGWSVVATIPRSAGYPVRSERRTGSAAGHTPTSEGR